VACAKSREQRERLAPLIDEVRKIHEEHRELRKQERELVAQITEELADAETAPGPRRVRSLRNKLRWQKQTDTRAAVDETPTLTVPPGGGWTTSVGGVRYCQHGLSHCAGLWCRPVNDERVVRAQVRLSASGPPDPAVVDIEHAAS
jgi:hypothetical protein